MDGVRIIDLDIGCANRYFVKEWEDQRDPPILVFKEKLMITDGRAEFGIMKNEMGSFGGADCSWSG